MVAPDVSVVIPTRDRWRMLQRTLLGPLSQVGARLEVLVVDDGSDDETARGIAALGDSRVQHVPGRGRGVSDARNIGVERARGKWIAFLDDDDLWAPDKLRRQVAAAEAASAVFAYTAAVQVDERLQIVPGTLLAPPPPGEVRRRLVLSNAIPAGCSNVLARATDAKAVEGFDSRLAQVADWDMWLQLVGRGAAIALPDVLVAYMQHDENMLLSAGGDPFAEFEILRSKHAQVSRELGQPFSRQHFARWVATGRRRRGERLAAVRLLSSPRGWRAGGYGGNLARAAGVAGGEHLLQAGRRLRFGAEAERPDWLDLYGG